MPDVPSTQQTPPPGSVEKPARPSAWTSFVESILGPELVAGMDPAIVLAKTQRTRFGWGMVTAFIALCILALVGWWDVQFLPAFDEVVDAHGVEIRDRFTGATERLVWMTVGVHAVITAAAVYLAYQLFRVAERFFLPLNASVELYPYLVGMRSPDGEVRRVLGFALKLAKAASNQDPQEAAKVIVQDAKDDEIP